MELNRGALGGGHGYGAPDGMQLRRRERALEAQLHELLFPSTSPSPTNGVGLSSSSELCGSGEHGSSMVMVPASCSGGGKRRGRSSKRVLDKCYSLQAGGCSAAINATCCRKKNQGKTTTLVTTVPGFDGYQWRKYGQKQIEAAQYSRSYYRCTHNTDKGCQAKRTVQRNNDDAGDSGPPRYTVVYISEHSCMVTEEVGAPTILETSTNKTAAPGIATFFPSSSSTAISTGTQSLASSDTTWSGGTIASTNPAPNECCLSMFAVDGDCWDEDPLLQQDMDFVGPMMSPVHAVAADGSWIHDLFDNESAFG
ncbi:uncharacterized protein [Lolium perenne]|uniref:uncharacterized protein n=1 Tax=Lolium perenne TaxID=4522 RepID=UPI0021F5B8EE|nr:probable WRKY transcription factor 29 [Lolium perenne]